MNDASIKSIIVDLGDNGNISFTYGIPISGIHIEDSKNSSPNYYDYVEIWYDDIDKSYKIGIRGLSISQGIIYKSLVRTAIIFYI